MSLTPGQLAALRALVDVAETCQAALIHEGYAHGQETLPNDVSRAVAAVREAFKDLR